MAEGRIDGKIITGQCIETLDNLCSRRPLLAGTGDGEPVPAWREKMKTLLAEVEAIKGKLFLKTKEGTELAELALKKLKALEALEAGPSGISDVPTAVEEMAAALTALCDKARGKVIRMT